MAGLLKRIFGGKPQTPTEDSYQGIYRRVVDGFEFRSGERLWPYLRAHDESELLAWFEPETEEAEPKSMVRFFASLMEGGIHIWEQKGPFQMYLHGRWSQGGGPSDRSAACLARMAVILGHEIKLFFALTEHSTDYRVMTFSPDDPQAM